MCVRTRFFGLAVCVGRVCVHGWDLGMSHVGNMGGRACECIRWVISAVRGSVGAQTLCMWYLIEGAPRGVLSIF